MERYFIVADDFTGSNDTGVQLTRRGVRTKVVLSPSAVADDGLSYVLDTESRNMPGETHVLYITPKCLLKINVPGLSWWSSG